MSPIQRRRQFLMAALGSVVTPAVRAQTANRVYTVGVLSLSSRAGVERYLDDFREGLREEGGRILARALRLIGLQRK